MKRDPDYFEGRESELIYIAKRLSDATALEQVFTAAGIDYGVEADEYLGGFIFRRVRTGAFFYVLSDARDQALSLMQSKGYRPLPPVLRLADESPDPPA